MRPQGGSLPATEALKWGFKRAHGILAGRHMLYRSATEEERAQNERTALSILLGELEDTVLKEMMKENVGLGCRVTALVFGGSSIVGGGGLDFAAASD